MAQTRGRLIIVCGLPGDGSFNVDLGHSAGTRVSALTGAGAAARGLWVM